jgi:hypothetical protein
VKLVNNTQASRNVKFIIFLLLVALLALQEGQAADSDVDYLPAVDRALAGTGEGAAVKK